LLGSGLVALADPAPVTTPVNTPDAASAGTNPSDPNEIVCRSMAPPTGTRLGTRRVCQTRHEWEMQYQETQRELQRQLNQGMGPQPGG
jgi:hypothetical protein